MLLHSVRPVIFVLYKNIHCLALSCFTFSTGHLVCCLLSLSCFIAAENLGSTNRGPASISLFDLSPYQSSSLIRSTRLSHSFWVTSPLCVLFLDAHISCNHRTTTVICGSVATKSYLKLPPPPVLRHIHLLCIPLLLAPGSSSIHTASDVRWSTAPLCSAAWKRVGRGVVTSG